MPLTRVDGDFSQISNVVQVVIPDPTPPPVTTGQVFVGLMSGETWLFENDLSAGTRQGDVDTELGFVNGYVRNRDSTIVGAYGMFGEGSAAGASRSEDQAFSWQTLGLPIYNAAGQRQSRAAFGGNAEDVFIHVGNTNSGTPGAAWSADFGNNAFDWNVINRLTQFQPGIGGGQGIAGIDAMLVDDADITGDTLFALYTNDGKVYAGDENGFVLYGAGGPTQTFNSSSSIPYARFAGQSFADNKVIVGIFCGRIVVTTNGSETWDMTTYNDAFCDTNQVGGAGFSNPVQFGLAYGGGVWVAVGTVDGAIRIRRSTIGAETPWQDVTPDITLDRILDVIYDSDGLRFLALGLHFEEHAEIVGFFHILKSTDGGLTWTDEIQQQYDGPASTKGWLMMLEVPPPSFNLLQEDGFLVQQEDDFAILVQSETPGTAPVVTSASDEGTANRVQWDAAVATFPGEVTSYSVFRISALEWDGPPNFLDQDPASVPQGVMSVIASDIDPGTLDYLDTDANNLLSQYCYYVRAVTTTGNLDSANLFSSAVS